MTNLYLGLPVLMLIVFGSGSNLDRPPKHLRGSMGELSVNGKKIQIVNWKLLEQLKDEKIVSVQLYGFSKWKTSLLDVKIHEEKYFDMISQSIRPEMCLRYAISDTSHSNAGGDGSYIGLLSVKTMNSHLVIGIDENGFSCGTALASTKSLFFSAKLALALESILKENGVSIPEKNKLTLSGNLFLKKASGQ